LQVGTEEEIIEYAKGIGDGNVIHHDTALMQSRGFKGVFQPGARLFDFASASVGTTLSGFAVEYGEMKFPHPVYAHDRITVEFRAAYRGRIGKIAIVAYTTNGDLVMQATARLSRII
jgi:acyl dehydratase